MANFVDICRVILTVTTEKIEFTVLEYKAKVTDKLYILEYDGYTSKISKNSLMLVRNLVLDRPHFISRTVFCFPTDVDNAKLKLYSDIINVVADIKDSALKLAKTFNVANIEDIEVVLKKRYDET